MGHIIRHGRYGRAAAFSPGRTAGGQIWITPIRAMAKSPVYDRPGARMVYS
jgi:hypothetical protein